MTFFGRAYDAAAQEYGRSRAEKYGRVARFLRWCQVAGLIAVALLVGWVAHR